MSSSTVRTSPTGGEPFRFAHPFFTPTPPTQRPPTPFGTRMLDFIKGRLQPVPAPTVTPPLMTLADVVGTAGSTAIAQTGHIRLHAVGDTGRGTDSPQGEVATAMAADFDVNHPAESPAFFLHLGDVIYGNHKDQAYRQEFYEPYARYPGKIIAIPGNHDGEVIPVTDPQTLHAFLANFSGDAATVNQTAGTILRQMVAQPGVYWRLDAPFVDIIGLYSNVAENPGFISGDIPGQAQKDWLVSTLQQLAAARARGTRKALVFATHHPPFSTGGHSGSQEMLADIDDACAKATIYPDLFLSGHSHSYQRYTRYAQTGGSPTEAPYVVAGIGGFNAQNIQAADGARVNDHTFVKSHVGYGYLLIDVSSSMITVRAIGVAGTQKLPFDHFAVDLRAGRVVELP